MNRDAQALAEDGFDVLVVGGGIHGASLAWEATLRGLSVALIDRADFGSATSANSLKTIHGGFRYLQHLDIKRVRESSLARRGMMEIAPHLVHPLPVVVPAYGHALKGSEAFRVALLANDLLTRDRNTLRDPEKHIPRGRLLSRDEVLRLLPGVPAKGLTGGALFYDAQVYNTERLTMLFAKSAEQAGASVCNYVEATGFVMSGGQVGGVKARDALSGDELEIRARVVVNTAGPWLNSLLASLGSRTRFVVPTSRAFNLVIERPLFTKYAVGLRSRPEPGEQEDSRGDARNLFVAPWRGKSLVGTSHGPFHGTPEEMSVSEDQIQSFLYEVNRACPALNIKREEVALVHCGLLPATAYGDTPSRWEPAHHDRIFWHAKEGLPGLVSVAGVKYTTARNVAERVLKTMLPMLGRKNVERADAGRLYGGEIADFNGFLRSEIERKPRGLGAESVRRLVFNYGAAYPEVLRYFSREDGAGDEQAEDLALLRAETLHATRDEMALKLSDVVFRRTELGSAGHPGNESLAYCAQVMAAEMGWSPERAAAERAEVERVLRYDVRVLQPAGSMA